MGRILGFAGVFALALWIHGWQAEAQENQSAPGAPDATINIEGGQLPPPVPKFDGIIKERSSESTPWWPPRVVPPRAAPNVLLILTDDQGYGVYGTFGGVTPTPTMDNVAAQGLRFTQFHSTALCSPTRAALITGRNHHSAGFGVVSEGSTGFPGYDSVLPIDKVTIGNVLRQHGYATSWFGKNHNTPAFQLSEAGPFNQWPSGLGFDYFYGFMSGETNQWAPYLFQNHKQIYPFEGKPGWNLTTAMADEAIDYLRKINAAAPDQPFLLYYAPGATHSPHHPTEEWIERIRAMKLFDQGWNAMRETIFANQKRLGVIPPDAELTAWPDSLPKWETLSAEQKKLYIRQAEVFAAYVAYTDHEIGRVIQEVKDQGKFDNTLVIYIAGDNGTSAEGTLTGAFNTYAGYNGMTEVPHEANMAHYDRWGMPGTNPHMAVPWAWAFDTPFKWTKQVASHFGGTRQGMAMSWPNGIKDKGGIRNQFHHVIDIMPTILEVVGIKAPTTVNGIEQAPIEGVSMAYTFDAPNAEVPSRRTTQYFEMLGYRGIYHEGWYAATTPPVSPWSPVMGVTLPDVVTGYGWELYDLTKDYSQARDVASEHPEKLEELKRSFDEQARKYNVFPLDNRAFVRMTTPRPSATAGRSDFVYKGVNPGIPTANAPSVLDRSFSIMAEVRVPQGGAEGMIVTHGGEANGYGLYLAGGKPVFTYNLLAMERFRWEGPPLSPGRHVVSFDFTYEGPGLGKGGTGVLKVDGVEAQTLHIPRTIPFVLTFDETFDVGIDTRTGVNDEDYSIPFRFSGELEKLIFKVGPQQMFAAQ